MGYFDNEVRKINSHKKEILFWSLEFLIVAALVWVCTQLQFIFAPVGVFISTLFAPILIAGFLYYMLNPLVKLLLKLKIKGHGLNRSGAVSLVFLGIFVLLFWVLASVVPQIISQTQAVIEDIPSYIKGLQTWSDKVSQKGFLAEIMQRDDVQSYLTKGQSDLLNSVKKFLLSLSDSFGSLFSLVANVVVTIVTVPFVLFYMLRDGYKLIPGIKKYFPSNGDKMEDLMRQMNETISRYIAGQAIECLSVGILSFIGYSLVGVPYALLVGIFAGITNIIPYLGPYIGLIPALLLASSHSLKMMIFVVIVCVVVQQIDGNLIYPNVIGKSLEIHPLTIILLLLVAGNLAGLLGMILGIPLYAVVKTVVKYFYGIYRLRKSASKT